MNRILIIIPMFSLALGACAGAQSIPITSAAPTPLTSAALPATLVPSAATSTLPPVVLTPATAVPAGVPPVPVSHPGDICGNPYYPVVDGAAWTYQTSLGAKARHTIADILQRTFTVVIKGSGDTFRMDGQCTDDGLILLEVPGVSGTYSSSGGGSSLTTLENEGVTLPNDIQVGDDWSQTIKVLASGGDSSLNATIETNYRALTYEAVTVPAGTFETLKIEQSGTMTMGGMTLDTHGYLWYAPGVGNVKAQQALGGDSPHTIELTAYNIPG